MYVAVVPNRNSPPAILLRESFSKEGKVDNRTTANLSHWPPVKGDALAAVLKGSTALGAPLPQAFDIVRSRPHGHVAAVLGTLRKLHLDRLFDKHSGRNRDLVLAMIAARVLEPASKLATSRALHPDTLSSTLGEVLHLDSVTEDELYEAIDWLVPQQARLRENLKPASGIEWITALRAPAIKKLASDGVLQLSLFDRRDLAEITHPDFPGERLVACYNPLLAEERARKRPELLAATEKELEKIAVATRRKKRPLRGKQNIGLRAGKVLNRYKMGKHFQVQIEDDSFTYTRKQANIEKEESLDGIYVIRTNVPAEALSSEQAVRNYKSLSGVERAFRSLKTVDLHVRPIHHRQPDRVRAHIFLCMLAYYVEWHLRKNLAPLLFDDEDKIAAEKLRTSVVAPSQRSTSAQATAHTQRTSH